MAVAVAAVEAMKYGHDAAAPAAKPVITAPETTVICAAGVIEPATEVIKLAAQVAGVLRDVPVEEGQKLRRGQVIAVIENADFVARVTAAEATVKERQASIDRLVNGSREQERRGRKRPWPRRNPCGGRPGGHRAQDGSFRIRCPFTRGARASRTRLSRRGSPIDTGHRAFRPGGRAARADELARAEADLELARAQLAEARALLEKTVVRAPFDGTVLMRFRRAGEAVSDKADTPVVSFGENSRLRVRVDVDETDIARLRVGARAYFTAQAFGAPKFWGRVVRIGQKLGKKNIETDQPGEKVDTKVLETIVELDGRPPLPAGLRVDSYLLVQN